MLSLLKRVFKKKKQLQQNLSRYSEVGMANFISLLDINKSTNIVLLFLLPSGRVEIAKGEEKFTRGTEVKT